MIPYTSYCDYEQASVRPICCHCKLPLDGEEKLKRGLTQKLVDKMPACDVCFEIFAAICRNPYWLMADIEARRQATEDRRQYERLKSGGDYFKDNA